MKNDNYSIEKKFLLNRLDIIKKDLLNLSNLNYKYVRYDMITNINVAINELKKYDLVLEKEI